MNSKSLRSQFIAGYRIYRTLRMIAKGLLQTRHPVLAHIIAIRRCNLSCSYCNEWDDHSKPVPLEEMYHRLDRLASFGTSIISISGGEPLLHPEIDSIISRIRNHTIIAGLITNGLLLTAERIARLNSAGLDYLQISIDNVLPDDVSKKSLKVLDKKLVLLAEHAEFRVNINTVLGNGVNNSEDALVIAHRAKDLGFDSTIGIIHDNQGKLKTLGERDLQIYRTISSLSNGPYASIIKRFQKNTADGRPNEWRCRAGSRYLYICEDGLVHYCSQQRGYPAIPLDEYTKERRRLEYFSKKGCASLCTLSCVQQIANFDNWRHKQQVLTPLQTHRNKTLKFKY